MNYFDPNIIFGPRAKALDIHIDFFKLSLNRHP